MNQHQRTAIENHCRFGFETAHPQFGHVVQAYDLTYSLVLTVNSGYE